MLAVIGDYIDGCDIFYTHSRNISDCQAPLVRYDMKVHRPGGAGAVAAMVRGMGLRCQLLGAREKPSCQKTRHVIGTDVIMRVDDDTSQPLADQEALELLASIPAGTTHLLVADYGMGVVTKKLWKGLLRGPWLLLVAPSMSRGIGWYDGADALICSRREACVRDATEATAECYRLEYIYPNVCITLDKEGMVFSGDDRPGHMKSQCQDPVDTCGAGDMVLAAIGVALYRGASWQDACEFANDMAARECQVFGVKPITDNIPDVRRCGRSVATSCRTGW